MTTAMTTNALSNWYGSNRTNAERPAKLLGPCEFIGVVFGGGMCELPYFDARQMVANDLHRHQVNLARVVADPVLYGQLKDLLGGSVYHRDTLATAQQRCLDREARFESVLFDGTDADERPDVPWAADYFVTSWMGTGGRAGTKQEFTGGLSVRFTAGGGGSSVRFWSAFDSLDAWHACLRRWEFTALDCFAFLRKCHDRPRYGLYLDPPWPGPGDKYRHRFGEERQRRLATVLAGFMQARLVIRYGDHPLIRELYPEGRWTWVRVDGRNQANGDVPEVLIVNGPVNEEEQS